MLAASTGVAAEPALRNWFDDPFFTVRNGIADCPTPAGPYTDEDGRTRQSHHRAEKGTTCWLHGACDRPKSSDYDADIAQGIREAFAATGLYADSTLWITVQTRIVYIEGCAGAATRAPDLEAFVLKVRHVERAVAILRTDPHSRAPYRLLSP